jgi:uncharacterized membrane protein (DUF4010 family)
MNLAIISKLAIALAIGLIIGTERGWTSRDHHGGLRIAGIRSFGFVGLFGGLSAILAQTFGVTAIAVAFVGLTVMAGLSYGLSMQRAQDFGITTELALFMTFLLGVMVGIGWTMEAVAVAVVIATLLGFNWRLD